MTQLEDVSHESVFCVAVRNRLLNSTGFFVAAWAFHYFPFFLMNRQLFLHHYLPAHLCSALVAGSVLNFILTESINYPISIAPPFSRPVRRTYSDLGFKSAVITLGLVALLIGAFLFLSPLTYGSPGYVFLCSIIVFVIANTN